MAFLLLFFICPNLGFYYLLYYLIIGDLIEFHLILNLIEYFPNDLNEEHEQKILIVIDLLLYYLKSSVLKTTVTNTEPLLGYVIIILLFGILSPVTNDTWSSSINSPFFLYHLKLFGFIPIQNKILIHVFLNWLIH